MCLAVPARVTALEGDFATIDLNGVTMRACIALLDKVEIGDFVIVHAGFAIGKLDLAEAEETLKLFERFGDEYS